uniref:RDR3 n=1 Tax=Arundo donax TaxID=35708 RepID=A0A0A9E8Q6_ARUDO
MYVHKEPAGLINRVSSEDVWLIRVPPRLSANKKAPDRRSAFFVFLFLLFFFLFLLLPSIFINEKAISSQTQKNTIFSNLAVKCTVDTKVVGTVHIPSYIYVRKIHKKNIVITNNLLQMSPCVL